MARDRIKHYDLLKQTQEEDSTTNLEHSLKVDSQHFFLEIIWFNLTFGKRQAEWGDGSNRVIFILLYDT